MVGVGILFLPKLLLLPVIGAWLWVMGGRELENVRQRHGLAPENAMPPYGARGSAAFGAGVPTRRGGFTREDVERLERQRGPLRRDG